MWLARWLRAREVDAQVIHPNSIAVAHEHRRAKTDRLDAALLKRSFLGWLRGEPDHCQMIAIPTLEEEDARRPGCEREGLVGERTRIINRIKSTLAWLGIRGSKPHSRNAAARLEMLRTPEGMPLPANTLAELHREMTRLQLIGRQIREIETARLERLRRQPNAGAHPMIRLLTQVRGVGVETADLLANEAFARPLRDQRAVARYGGLTGAPDESGSRRREKGLARAGNARIRRGMARSPRIVNPAPTHPSLPLTSQTMRLDNSYPIQACPGAGRSQPAVRRDRRQDRGLSRSAPGGRMALCLAGRDLL